MDKRELLKQLVDGQITIKEFESWLEIIEFNGSVPLSYWINKIEWTGEKC